MRELGEAELSSAMLAFPQFQEFVKNLIKNFVEWPRLDALRLLNFVKLTTLDALVCSGKVFLFVS